MRLRRALLLTVALVGGACEASPPATEACEEMLPEEGSLCPKDGEVCAPERDGCGLYHGLRCRRCSVDSDTDAETTGGEP